MLEIFVYICVYMAFGIPFTYGVFTRTEYSGEYSKNVIITAQGITYIIWFALFMFLLGQYLKDAK